MNYTQVSFHIVRNLKLIFFCLIGVQDMACDTFLKICQKCKKKFVQLQKDEPTPFVDQLVQQLPTIINDLQTHQIHSFYEAVATMIQAEQNV